MFAAENKVQKCNNAHILHQYIFLEILTITPKEDEYQQIQM